MTFVDLQDVKILLRKYEIHGLILWKPALMERCKTWITTNSDVQLIHTDILKIENSYAMCKEDNAKSMHCHGFNVSYDTQKRYVKYFWKGWTDFKNIGLVGKLQKLKQTNTTISSLLIQQNPKFSKIVDQLHGIDTRADILLEMIDESQTTSS